MFTSRGNVHRSRLAVLAGALLVLTACQGDAPAAPSEDEGSTSQPTASESSSPAFDATAPENLDPCSMVPRDTWLTFVPKDKRDVAQAQPRLAEKAFPGGLGGIMVADELPKYACLVTFPKGDDEEFGAISWGWYLGSFGPPQVNKLVATSGGEKHDRGTYAAVTTGDLLTSNAIGITPSNVGFFVVVDAPLNSDRRIQTEPDDGSGGDKVFTMDLRMLEVLDLVAEHTAPQPLVMLPEGCPAAQDPAITAVVGKVRSARGSNDGEGTQSCLYRSPQRRTVLRLTGGTGTQEVIDDHLETATSQARAQDRFEGPPGTEGQAVTTSSGAAAGTLVDPESLRFALATVERDQFVAQSPKVPRAALVELLATFYEDVPAAVE